VSNEASVALIVAVVGVIGTMGGVWLGRLMERSNEAMKWRRERRLESYADLFAACEALLLEASRAFVMSDPQDRAVIAQNEVVMTKLTDMLRLYDKATLVGSREINPAIRSLSLHYQMNVTNGAVSWPKPSQEEWDQKVLEAANLYRRAVDLARKDLDIEDLIQRSPDALLRFNERLLLMSSSSETIH
jgi:hypothetical protein